MVLGAHGQLDGHGVALQAFFNFAVTARAKGCKLMLIYPPHSPEGADLNEDTLRKLWRPIPRTSAGGCPCRKAGGSHARPG